MNAEPDRADDAEREPETDAGDQERELETGADDQGRELDDAEQAEPPAAELEVRLAQERAERAQSATDDFPLAGASQTEPALEVQPYAPPEARPLSADELAQVEMIEGLEKARVAHRRKLEKLLGPEVPLTQCDKCEGQGNLPPWLLEETAFADDPHRRACETCRGLGAVRTGSQVPDQDVLTCLDCAGRGWQGDEQAEAPNGSARTVEGWNPEWGAPPLLPTASGD